MVVQQQLLGSQIPPFAHFAHKSFGANLNVTQDAPPTKKPRKQSLVRKSGAASFNGLLIGGAPAEDTPKRKGRGPSLKTRIAAAAQAAAVQQNGQPPAMAPANAQGWSSTINPAMNGAKGVPDEQFLKQLQQHFLQQQDFYRQQRSHQPQGHVNFVGKTGESVLCSPPPASANYVTGSENPMTNNKQNHLLGQQFSPTMGPTGFGQFNCQQVVPELTSNSMGVMTSPPHHQHPHSVLLTPPSESHGHQHPHPQAFQAFSEKQQHEVAQQLAFQHLNALQAPQQQSINMNSLLAALAQQQSSLAGNSAPTSNGNLLTQIPMSVHPNQALLYAAVMAQTQAGSTAALQSLLQQQLASNYENGQHQTAAQASVMMQSSPHSFATSSSSMTGSSEGSRSSPPPPSMTFRHAQNQMNCEAAFGSPPPTATEANYGDCDAFEQTNATHHVNDLNEKPERRLTEKEMQAIHSLINLREGGNTSANSHN
ncbi:hypothetical protein Ddc_06002 [Ditylenchus destructor]|nr:hypothetical protein Ddc_06002 [Ditylenchus destructor]